MHKLYPLLLSLLLIGCGSSGSDSVEEDAKSLDISMSIHFSQTEGSFEGGADDLIVEDIAQAQESIRLSMYDFTNDKILEALLDAYRRGVEIRVHTDDAQLTEEAYEDLAEAGIELTYDSDPNALMHDKSLVIDHRIVWMGSANYTYYSFYRNNEDLIRWESEELAAAYEEEFEERVEESLEPKIYEFDGVSLYFTPEDDFRQKIVSLIDGAKEEIDFMIYTFTDAQIADALIRARDRGVRVRGIFDEDQDAYQSYSKYDTLKEAGLDVHLDGNPYKLHHKVMIIDANTTVVGSYNFTDAAQTQNNEEGMVITGESAASAFLEEFERCYEEAQ